MLPILKQIQASLLRMTPEGRARMKTAFNQVLDGGRTIAAGLTLTAGVCVWTFTQLGIKMQLGTAWPEFLAEVRRDAAATGREVAELFEGVA